MASQKQTSLASKSRIGIVYGLLAMIMFAAYLLTNRYVYVTYKVDAFNYTVTFSLWAGFFAVLGLAANRYKQKFTVFKKSTLPVLLTGMLAGVGVGCIVLGQRYTTAINASILATASTIPTVLFSWLMLKERFSRRQWLWMAVMFVGLYLAIVGLHSLHLNKGDVIILGSAFILGFTNTFSKILMKDHSSDFVADIRLVGGGILFIVMAVVFGRSDFLITNAHLWPILGGLFYWLTIKFFYAAIQYINPSKAIIMINSHPILTPFVGVLVLSEPYSWIKFAGSALIITSIYFINKR